MTYLQVMG